MCWERGQGGQLLHGDVTSTGPGSSFHTYELGAGRTHTGSVNTAYQLLDVTEADGGFVVRPTTHGFCFSK